MIIIFSDPNTTTRYRDLNQLIAGLNGLRLQRGRQSFLTQALQLAQNSVFQAPADRSNYQNIIIVIMGTTPNVRPSAVLINQARLLNQLRIYIYGVGVSNQVDQNILRQIVTDQRVSCKLKCWCGFCGFCGFLWFFVGFCGFLWVLKGVP